MDEITRLMHLIDANSEYIKEGHYLEMCNIMKSLYHKIPSQHAYDEIMREWRNNAVSITDLQEYIGILERCLKSLKYLRNVTKAVKIEAIIHRAEELGIVLMENTVHALRSSGVDIPDERKLYDTYIVARNADIAENRTDVQHQLQNKREELEAVRQRQRWIMHIYNL